MVLRLSLYLSILVIGGVIGNKNIFSKKIMDKTNTLQTISLLGLLFIMGMRIGMDKKVIASFLKLGFQAIILSIFSILFSVLLVKISWGLINRSSKVKEENNR